MTSSGIFHLDELPVEANQLLFPQLVWRVVETQPEWRPISFVLSDNQA